MYACIVRGDYPNLPLDDVIAKVPCEMVPEACNDIRATEVKELSKTNLLKLQNDSMEAQFVNTQLNAFTSVIAAKVNEFQHQGKVQ